MLLAIIFASCGGGGVAIDDPNLTTTERDAVKHFKEHLPRKETLVAYQAYEGPMPVELMTDYFKGMRDDVNKAGLDYVNCVKRGLQEQAEKQVSKIQRYQEEILVKSTEWSQEQGTSEYAFVMADVKDRTSSQIKKVIAVYNKATMQKDFELPLTKPFVNNASMILNANNGTLFEYATDPNHDTAALAAQVTNPVLKFIFEADPATVR